MEKNFEAICVALDDLAKTVIASTTEDRTMTEAWGWNFPVVTRHDLASIASNLASKIRGLNPDSVDPTMQKVLPLIVQKIGVIKAQTVPYLFNGNGNQAAPAYMAAMRSIENRLDPLFSWERLSEAKALPVQMTRRLRSVKAEVDQIVVDRDALNALISTIQGGAEAAESLPADLASLEAARKKVSEIERAAQKISDSLIESRGSADSHLSTIVRSAEDAEKLVKRCEEAYRITTTNGLAGAFDRKAITTARSMWVWVFGLFVALGVGAWQGSHRLSELTVLLKTAGITGVAISSQLVTSLLSVGAPIWFAWLATKQIGQRFRLSEDYAYKASVAKAYEGYRKEAVRIDSELEKRLFASALTRLEEPPLRLVETDTPGSPWHELLKSPVFKETIRSFPDFRDKLLEVMKKSLANEMKRDTSKPIPPVE